MVAGEPGGSVPAMRERLSRAWNGARIFDHHGMTEVGPVSFQCPAKPGVLHIIEESFIPEIIDPVSGRHVATGEQGELVLTNLGRVGSPLLRYRTGDLVRAAPAPCACGRHDLALVGGILGRTDDMVVIRGVNVYPSAVEEIIRSTGAVAEFRAIISQAHALSELRVEIEPLPTTKDSPAIARHLEEIFEAALFLRVPVTIVPPGSLPRFEMKARRWIRS
jgi:phenylacetate-CoA ligase